LKSLHFCTKNLLTQIYEGQPGNIIETYRTGYVPNIYLEDIINLKDRLNNDKIICKGLIVWVWPLQYKELSEFSWHNKGLEELDQTYKRKFHDKHWVFDIGIRLYPEVIKGTDRYYQHIPPYAEEYNNILDYLEGDEP